MACATSRDPFDEGGPSTELTGGMFRAPWIFGGGPVLGYCTGLAVPSPLERLAPATQVRRLPTV
jgi:hypothetical protein